MNSTVSEEKGSARLWSTDGQNHLNVRIGHKLSTTVPTGEYQSEHAEWWIEQDLPTGSTVDDVQDLQERQLQERREKWRAKVNASQSSMHPKVNTSPSPSLASPAVQSTSSCFQSDKPKPQSPLSTDLRPLRDQDYSDYRSGNGAWTFSEKLPIEILELLKKGPVNSDGYTYKLSGPADAPTKFVSRYRIKGEKK